MRNLLPFLFLLACPISMFAMMFMLRGKHQDHGPKAASIEERLAKLESEKADLERHLKIPTPPVAPRLDSEAEAHTKRGEPSVKGRP